ncbi:helix-turn-helix transcriptional regulator [Hoeflea alexandrii]|uniref:helix-turn-helix transcriptional regulator n=1 Tax=Hoeflea alexandrii TaxID=288436 RepID=UPI0022AF35F0|nr:helix-turn-helix transcriptional regulator [Hoeflea alexandrii]MCZ4291531.1 helix-turn-helix transcriptional regulator [Hoeflea alexandrii]
MNLSSSELTRLNEAILSLYTPFGLSELPDRFLRATRLAMAGDLTHISLTSPANGTVDAMLDQPAHAALAALSAHREDLLAMPGFSDGSFYLRADGGPVSYLDFMDHKRLESTALWEFLCRPLGIAWDLSVNFHRTDSLFFTISTSRGGSQYGDTERTMLALLQPHLRQRFALAVMAEPDHPLLHMDSSSIAEAAGHIVCDADGHILFAPDATLESLQRAGIQHGNKLPDEWLRWINGGSAKTDPVRVPPSLSVRTKGGEQLSLHHLHARAEGEHHLLVELPASVSRPLSRREEDVAHWLAQGKTNREIAGILEVSPSTVKHHVASILDKLMVENRTTAAVRLRSRRH